MNNAELLKKIGLQSTSVLGIIDVYNKIKPHLSDVAIEFMESTPISPVSEATCNFGITFYLQNYEANYKIFGKYINKLFEELHPIAMASTFIQVNPTKSSNGVEQYFLLWFAEYAEFKTASESLTWRSIRATKN